LLKRLCIGAFAALIILLTLIVAAGQYYLCSEDGRRQIQALVNGAIPGTLTWNACSLSLLTGKVTLENARLTGPDGQELITIGRLSARVSLTALMAGDLSISDVAIDEPVVHLGIDANGSLDLVDAFVAPDPVPAPVVAAETDSTFNLIIKDLLLRGGALYLVVNSGTDTAPPHRFDFHDIRISGTDGDLVGEQATVSLQSARGKITIDNTAVPYENLVFSGSLNRDRCDPIHLALSTPQANIDISGNITGLWHQPVFDLSLQGGAALARLNDILKEAPDMSGALKLSGSVKGNLDTPTAAVTLSVANGTVADLKTEQLDLTARLADGHLLVDRLAIQGPAGQTELTGTLDLSAAFPNGFVSSLPDWQALAYHADITHKVPRLDAVLDTAPTPNGSAATRIVVEGRGVDPETLAASLDLTVSTDGMRLAAVARPINAQLTARAEMEQGRLTVRDFILATDGHRLAASGAYRLSDSAVTGQATLSATDLPRLFSQPDVRQAGGDLTLAVKLDGTVDQPRVAGEMAATEIRYSGITVGDQAAAFRFEDGLITVDQLEIRNGPSVVSVSGSIRLMEKGKTDLLSNPRFAVTFSGRDIDLQGLFPDAAGTLGFDGDIDGPLDRLKGNVAVNGTGIDLFGYQTIDTLNAACRLENNTARIDTLKLGLGPDTVEAAGWISVDGNYEIHTAANEIPVHRIDTLRGEDNGEETLSFTIDGRGNLEAPVLKGEIQLGNLQANDTSLDDIVIRANLADNWLTLTGRNYLDLDARLNIQTRAFTVDAALVATDLTPVFALLDQDTLSGSVQGTLKLGGNLDAHRAIEGRLQVDKLEITHEQTALINWSQGIATLEDGHFLLPDTRIQLLESGELNLSGQGDWAGNLQFQAAGRIPLALLETFTREVTDLEGALTVGATVTGTLAAPEIEAGISFVGIAFTYPEFYQKISGLNGTITVKADQAVFDNIRGQSGNGNFSLQGSVNMKGFVPQAVAIKTTTRKLPVNVPSVLEVVIDSDLDLSGPLDTPRLTGEVTFLEGLYYEKIELNLLEIVAEQALPGSRTAVDEEPPDYLKNIAFDVRFRYRQPFVIDNNMALLTLQPNLRLYGTYGRPLLSGRAQVGYGSITFQRQEFEITRGVVDFLNPYKIEPTLDIKSTTRVKDWTIDLAISGTPDNLEYTLTSDPSEQRADILSLLAFGKTTRGWEDGADEESSPGQLLADLVALELQDQLKDSTGLDSVEVNYKQGQAEDEQDRIKVSVGKELSRRLALKYGVERNSGELIQSVESEYKFLEDLLMIISQDSEGDFGSEIKYKIRFR
jgi:translocation and assembly module TamB